ncbi:hypothetical protein G9A89_016059 [Geosiphon pyriformis]|nr:hypothetical protein G9A89_016059 [Geosiphon pyriformis]
MDLKAASGSDMSKKKAPKSTLYGPASSSFSQKKKVVLGNVKHSGDEKNISLVKLGSDDIYSNIDSESSCSEDNTVMENINSGSLLGSAANTPRAKSVDSSMVFGFPFGSPNYEIEEKVELLPSPLSISLEKKWIDPKIMKTSVEVFVRKSFALNINFLAVEGKSATAKTQFIRKIFSTVNGFGGATIFSKFEGIIKSIFTLIENMKWASSLAKKNGIIVNTNLRKQDFCSDQAVIIKKIPMNTPKEIIVATVSEFGDIKLIKVQLIGIWQKAVLFLIGKDSVHIAMAIEDCETWAFKDWFRVLLFILPVGTTTHDLCTLLDRTSEKMCVINYSLKTGNRTCCAIVDFESESGFESAFHTEPIFGGIKLFWARLNLVQYERYGKFGHLSLECNASDVFVLLYTKKNISISHPAAFGSQSWAQMVLMASLTHGLVTGFGAGSLCSGASILGGFFPPFLIGNSSLGAHLVSLEHSLELLTDQVSVIDTVMNEFEVVDSSLSFITNKVSVLGPSSSKILITKISCLESKFIGLFFFSMSGLIWKIATYNVQSINVPTKQEDVVYWHKESENVVSIITETKLRIFLTGLNKGFLGVRVAIIIDNNLACYICKIKKIPDRVILVWLLFKGKLLVSILGLYASASAGARFSQALKISAFIAKTVNSSTFLVIGGNFNESGSRRSTCFRFCSDLGLVNSFSRSSLIKTSIWSNFRGVEKTIDFVFVSASLASVVAECAVSSASEFFEFDHKVVLVLVGLGGLVNINLNSLYKQTNRNKWKFKIKSAMFSKFWFNDFECSRNKISSKFFKLELLISKLVKDLSLHWNPIANHFIDTWSVVDFEEASKFHAMVDNGAGHNAILGHLFGVKKRYCRSKYFESRNARNVAIRKVVNKYMENFCTDKGRMIKSVLEWPFCKMVLNHLVVNNDLVLESGEVKFAMRKHAISNVLFACWTAQYAPLMVKCLPDDKAAGLSGIPNKLWKHACSKFDVLQGNNFLVLKDTSIQTPIFAIGLIVEDALEKNRELWLVFQDMYKMYDSVEWFHLCNSLAKIKMFMTDFGLTDSYIVHNCFDQEEVFSFLLWKIFYDPLLCEIKHCGNLFGYRLNSKFFTKSSKPDFKDGLTSFLTAGAFIDDTI